MQICEIFRGKVVDVTQRSMIVEVTGTTDKSRPSSRWSARSASSR
jgi:acetolactate synthase small subunit